MNNLDVAFTTVVETVFVRSISALRQCVYEFYMYLRGSLLLLAKYRIFYFVS